VARSARVYAYRRQLLVPPPWAPPCALCRHYRLLLALTSAARTSSLCSYAMFSTRVRRAT